MPGVNDATLLPKVAELAAQGHGRRRIADALGVSEKVIRRLLTLTKNGAAAAPVAQQDLTSEDLDASIRIDGVRRARYTIQGDEYVFPVLGQLIHIKRDRWEEILADDSHQGRAMTRHAIAMKHGIGYKTLEACLRAYSQFKARPPVSRESIAEAAEAKDAGDPSAWNALYQQAVETQEQALAVRIQANRDSEHKKIAKRAMEELVALKHTLKSFAENCAASWPLPTPMPRVPSFAGAGDDAPEVSIGVVIADLHAGKKVKAGAVAGVNRPGMDRERFLQRAHVLGRQLQTRLRTRKIKDNELTAILLGDLLESLMADMHWGHAGEVWATGYLQVRGAVDWLEIVLGYLFSVVERVRLASIAGNHDRVGDTRGHDPARTGHAMVIGMLADRLKRTYCERFELLAPKLEYETEGEDSLPYIAVTLGGEHRVIGHHGEYNLTPEKLMLMDKERTGVVFPRYMIVEGHRHDLDYVQKLDYIRVRCPSVIGGDPYSHGRLGFASYGAVTLLEASAGDPWPTPMPLWIPAEDNMTRTMAG